MKSATFCGCDQSSEMTNKQRYTIARVGDLVIDDVQ